MAAIITNTFYEMTLIERAMKPNKYKATGKKKGVDPVHLDPTKVSKPDKKDTKKK